MSDQPRIPVDRERIIAFCRKWRITEFSLFGSVLRDDFRPDSDVDVLLQFAPDHPWSLFDVMDMEDELKAMFGRDVDLVMKGGLRNPFRRAEILRTRQVVYAS
jgi:predicted nucleotidyltransferase